MTNNLKAIVEERLLLLHAAMGKALWQCQGCEQMLAKYHAVAAKLVGTPSEQDIVAEFEKNFAHTAGRLLGIFKKDVAPDAKFAARLDAFVKERNWLAHKLRRLDFDALKDEAMFSGLLARLSALESEAIALVAIFDDLMMDHFVKLGGKRDELEKLKQEEYARLFANKPGSR